MTLVNLTRQPLRLYDVDGRLVEVPPDARHVAVLAVGEPRRVTGADGHAFALTVRTVTGVRGMPAPEPGTLYVVPVEIAMVLQGERDDVAFAADETTLPGPDGRPLRVTQLRLLVVRLAPPE